MATRLRRQAGIKGEDNLFFGRHGNSFFAFEKVSEKWNINTASRLKGNLILQNNLSSAGRPGFRNIAGGGIGIKDGAALVIK